MAENHSDIIGWKHLPIFPQKLPVPFVPTQAAQQTRLVCCTGLKITFLCLSLIWFTIWPLGELYQHSYGSPAMGTGSGGGGKLPRKTLHPEGTRRSQENLRWVKRMMDKQKFTPGLQQCIGDAQGSYQDHLHLLSVLLPRAGHAKPHPWHLAGPTGGSRLGITSNDFGQTGGERVWKKRVKGDRKQHRSTQMCFSTNVKGNNSTSQGVQWVPSTKGVFKLKNIKYHTESPSFL